MFKTLIVEDNSQFRQIIKNTIHTQFPSMDIKEAQDGSEAMEIVKTFQPDLIFMDIRLPGETGLEVSKKIKRDFPKTKIIILTNFDLPEYREAAFSFGADHFLSKELANGEVITSIIESIIANVGINGKQIK